MPATKKLFRALAVLCIVGVAVTAWAQLDAPTALSDYSGCAHHTCTWVPSFAHSTFHAGDLTYTVLGADFVLRRAKKTLLRTSLKDLSASVSVVWSDNHQNFAITWSDGGAIGGFHVRAFHVEGDTVTESPAWQKAWNAFKVRHWCRTRGDNIQAFAWLPDSRNLILVLSVYPTSDCGAELGHTEAYVVDASTGDIQENWAERKLNVYMRAHPE
jgi:hypothetical protein